MSTSTEVETVSRIDAAGLSAMIAAAQLFTLGKPGKRSSMADDPPRYCRVRVAGRGGVLGIESTDVYASRFTAVAVNVGRVPEVDVTIDADAIASACRGGGFDSAAIGGGRFATRGASIDAAATGDPWPVTVDDPSPVALRVVTDAATFARIAREVAVAADEKSARYALGGVAIDVEAPADGSRYGRAHAIATDGRRLHALTLPRAACHVNGSPIESGYVIVPASIVARAAKSIAASIPRGVDPESVAVTIDAGPITGDGNRAAVAIEWRAGDFTATIVARPTMGRFPRWRDVLTGDAARGPLTGDAAPGDAVATWSADAKSVAAACRDALRGVCRPGKRGDRPRGVDFTAGDAIPGGAGARFPRMSAETAAGGFDRVMGAGTPDNLGTASPAFSVRLDPRFVADAVAGFGRGEVARFATIAGTAGESAVYLRRGRGIDSEHATGFTVAIMPVSRE